MCIEQRKRSKIASVVAGGQAAPPMKTPVGALLITVPACIATLLFDVSMLCLGYQNFHGVCSGFRRLPPLLAGMLPYNVDQFELESSLNRIQFNILAPSCHDFGFTRAGLSGSDSTVWIADTVMQEVGVMPVDPVLLEVSVTMQLGPAAQLCLFQALSCFRPVGWQILQGPVPKLWCEKIE